MVKEKIELTLQDESGQEYVAYPFVESEDVTLSNGMDIETMIAQDVSMPIVTHEETSFKVGVGDSNISNSIVDSSVANMTIKGQTYQNILPDPTLRNSMTNGKTMQKLNEGYESVNTVDGVCKSAILKGQTLVNLCVGHLSLSNTDSVFTTYSDGTYTYSAQEGYDGSIAPANMLEIKTPYKLKPNNTYTIIVTQLTGGESKFGVRYWDGNNNYDSAEDVAKTGVHKHSFRTSDNDGDSYLALRLGHYTSERSISFKDIILLEGDYTNVDIPYFEGMQSVKVPVLTTTGKNLFDGLSYIDGFIASGNDYTVSYDADVTSILVNVNKNTDYILSAKTNFNRNTVGGSLKPISTGTKTTSLNSERISNNTIKFNSGEYTNVIIYLHSSKIDIEDIQIEQGTVATTYEPYKTNILSCELTPMDQSMFEQGTFAESTPPNTQSYENIKINSGSFYNTRIRTKGTYKVVKGATYSGQLNNAYGIFICYCKNGLYSAKDKGWIDETNFTFTVPNDCDEMFFAIRKTDNTVISPSDYPLIGLKIHQEVVLRSLPNGVCDTLDLMTGEYVQRIGEVVLDGSETWYESGNVAPNHYCAFARVQGSKNALSYNIVCSSLPVRNILSTTIDYEGCMFNEWSSGDKANVVVKIANSKLSSASVEGIKAYLQSNPLTVQYELATPIIKTVDLSSSGNWEKVVLDGSEYWKQSTANNNYFMETSAIKSNYNTGIENLVFSGDHCLSVAKVYTLNTDTGLCVEKSGGLRIRTQQVLEGQSIGDFKAYLSQNPVTVYYQTKTHQDSTQVKQPIFFKDGYIQLSSGVDNSLIPTLDYEAKTSNSYVMDLMKTNTKYTMKAKSVSGTFTIDGTSYGAGTNGTFTTPSTMNNKLMIANGTVTDLMFIEGDVTGKDMSYFKGIKSAFEDEDKIEVLSTGKNLLKKEDCKEYILKYYPEAKFYVENGIEYCETVNYLFHEKPLMQGQFKKNTVYTVSLRMNSKQKGEGFYLLFMYTDGTHSFAYTSSTSPIVLTLTSNKNKVVDYIYFSYNNGGNVVLDLDSFQLTETESITDYEPYKSNCTKIPLLSPLRSLPNGVKDEVILDRENHKAKIIQRVGKTTLDGSENWVQYGDVEGYYAMQTRLTNCKGAWSTCYSLCDKLRYNEDSVYYKSGKAYTLGAENDVPNAIYVCLPKSELTSPDAKGFKQWMRDNTPVVTYRLATPVITEVDLEGFPYIYKDGHILLNTDIAPTSEITCSINQQQQIEASNEDLMRHEKKITNLHKLIGTYVNVEYESTLLALNLELK